MVNGKAKSIMIQGTSSSAGKSALTAGFLRYFSGRCVNCSPFKPQNMSLNSFVTEDGFEIAVSQAVQSEAAFKKPLRQMNPILIKPSSDTEMHLIVDGKHFGNMNFRDYNRRKDFFLGKAAVSFEFLAGSNDLVVIEGAGSPAEINLFKYDIANMGFAEIYDIPVILVADIERGGVFASLYGTVKLLPPKWRKLVKGFIINKFRGDVSILEPGIRQMENKLKIPCLGVIPYIKNMHIEAEDSLNFKKYGIYGGAGDGRLKIGIVRLNHISNFNEFDPLFFDERLSAGFFDSVPYKADEFDMIIIPGSKSTAADLADIKNSGLFDYIKRFGKSGKGIIMGICGGFQMMGERITDPHNLESAAGIIGEGGISGFGFFKTVTELSKEKILAGQKYGFKLNDNACRHFIDGYEIHNGRTFFSKNYYGGDITSDIFEPAAGGGGGGSLPEAGILSILSEDKRKIGTYVHGLFANEIFKDFIIESLNKSIKNKKNKNEWKKNSSGYGETGRRSYEAVKNDSFNLLSENIEKHLNIGLLKSIAGI
jgi:adenosylcobyric acid synthase